ncbi:MAG: hypothetical protein QMD85_00195 [Candidatus Aenigmarchaeota archaeon]|nr:hypothetical protein [Candidatus Aenigmarchaeota archaeon]MDI6721947.1 hypothetical protein [Candidatus Aenigmarchaeota archaeon]
MTSVRSVWEDTFKRLTMEKYETALDNVETYLASWNKIYHERIEEISGQVLFDEGKAQALWDLIEELPAICHSELGKIQEDVYRRLDSLSKKEENPNHQINAEYVKEKALQLAESTPFYPSDIVQGKMASIAGMLLGTNYKKWGLERKRDEDRDAFVYFKPSRS